MKAFLVAFLLTLGVCLPLTRAFLQVEDGKGSQTAPLSADDQTSLRERYDALSKEERKKVLRIYRTLKRISKRRRDDLFKRALKQGGRLLSLEEAQRLKILRRMEPMEIVRFGVVATALEKARENDPELQARLEKMDPYSRAELLAPLVQDIVMQNVARLYTPELEPQTWRETSKTIDRARVRWFKSRIRALSPEARTRVDSLDKKARRALYDDLTALDLLFLDKMDSDERKQAQRVYLETPPEERPHKLRDALRRRFRR